MFDNEIAQTVEKAREQFYAVSLDRIENARNLLNELKQDPNRKERIKEINELLHRLAGSSGLYDMAEFCDRALMAEDLSMQMFDQNATAIPTTVDQLMRLTNSLYHLLMAHKEDGGNQQKSSSATRALQQSLEALKRSILLVGANSSGLVPHIKDLGFKINTVPDFTAARTYLASRALPDGLVIDTDLKGGSPLELAALVRQKPDSAEVPIILFGNEGDFTEKIVAIQAGCDDFWNRNADAEALSIKAARVFSKICTPRYKILVVEDDPVQAAAMHVFLDAAGFEPMVMTNPALFEEGLLASEPDLILLDLMLGDVTGFDLAKFVRQNDKFDTTPIVFLTTQNQLENQVRGKRLGDDYL